MKAETIRIEIMSWDNFDVIGGFNQERTPLFNCEDAVNWYVIQNSDGKKSQALARVPGLHLEKKLNTSSYYCRPNGIFSFENGLFVVVGNSVYLLDTSLNINVIGSIATTTGYLSIDVNNSKQIIFVDGDNGYIYDTNSETFSSISDPDFPSNPEMVAFLDGYFVLIQGATNTFILSAPNDGTNWNFAGNPAYASANAYPGVLIGLAVVNRRLFLFKETSTEVWYNAGASDFPFRRDNNSIFSFGCATKFSIAVGNGLLLWLSLDQNGNYSVMMSDGTNPQKVSNSSVENLISNFTNPIDLDCLIRKTEDGHLFYQMNWTTDDYTLVYDITTQIWHRMALIKKNPILDVPLSGKIRHLANSHTFFNGKHFVGSYNSTNIYSMSLDYSSNAGQPIVAERVFKHFSQSNYRGFQVDALQLDFQTGIGNESGIYIAPGAYLSISKDGGISFGNEMRSPLGAQGRRYTRTRWWQLGTYYDFVAKVKVYANVSPLYLLGGAINSTALDK